MRALLSRWERTVDIRLAQGVAKIAIGGPHTAAPAWSLLFSPGERMGEEIEVLVDDGLVQKGADRESPASGCRPASDRGVLLRSFSSARKKSGEVTMK